MQPRGAPHGRGRLGQQRPRVHDCLHAVRPHLQRLAVCEVGAPQARAQGRQPAAPVEAELRRRRRIFIVARARPWPLPKFPPTCRVVRRIKRKHLRFPLCLPARNIALQDRVRSKLSRVAAAQKLAATQSLKFECVSFAAAARGSTHAPRPRQACRAWPPACRFQGSRAAACARQMPAINRSGCRWDTTSARKRPRPSARRFLWVHVGPAQTGLGRRGCGLDVELGGIVP